jgi:tRNA-dihydrouridine synthase
VITFHFRTRKEMSKVPAHWELAQVPVKLAQGSETLIFGNGDVKDLADAREKAEKYGLDGIMLGRAIYGNPWLFSERTPTITERLKVLVEHTELFEKMFRPGATNDELFKGHTKSFAIMKKHFKAYVEGFDGAVDLRSKLMMTESAPEVRQIIGDFLNN